LVLEEHVAVALRFTKGLLILSGGTDQEAEDQIDADYSCIQGDDIVIGINHVYLTDVLRVIESQNVKLLFGDSNDAFKIVDMDCTDDDFIIMPMRL